jgi:hypothetical protein
MAHSSGPSLPIVEHHAVEIDADDRRELARMARKLRSEEPALSSTEAFGPLVAPGLGPWPNLVLEDHSWIVLFEKTGDVAYTYRALLLAGDGDQVVVGIDRSIDFETYCRDVLGLGRVEVLSPDPAVAQGPLAVRCANDPELLDRIARRAHDCGGLNLMPYMGTGGVWMLAGRIAARSGRPVRVAAPPPRLTLRVNDKVWFAQRVAELLGRGAVPSAYAVFNLAALAGRVAALGKRHASVAVKLTSSASSAGNIVLGRSDLTGVSLRTLHGHLCQRLRALGWRDSFPLMVTAWEQPVVASPSAQLWIPDPGQGGPIVEGIFDQVVMGQTGVFSGAAPSALSGPRQRQVADEAARLACLFQDLGYFGRCSFDAILVGDNEADARLHWVECNGRWGGVSIPMTLANRLVGDWARHPPVIIERCDLRGPRRDLPSVLAELDDDLYRPRTHPEGAVVLSPGRLEEGTGFELMVLGDSTEAAQARAQAVAAKLAPSAGRS